MTARWIAALLLVSLALAGCGGAERGSGSARLWITRDRGTTLLVDTTVPAGETLMRALRFKVKVETRYGGRFVEAIDGVHGSLSARHDWFWFVNGLAGDTSAAEYRLHAGDVAWWDYRDWSDDPELAVVVGAFPEPFLHGVDGVRRSVVVRYANSSLRADARRIGRRIHASGIVSLGVRVPFGVDVFELLAGPPTFVARQKQPGSGPRSPIVFSFSGDVDKLLAGAYTRRFSVP
ncbi:MAG: DUF4430 domain-containing protein [Gaiellaceae bacterium]